MLHEHFGHSVSWGALAVGWSGGTLLVQLTAVENFVQMSAFYDQEPSWQHISFPSMVNLIAGFLLDICYV